jgi:hypothetical protein
LRLAAAREETSGLGAPDAPLTLERIAGQSNVQQRVAV